MKSSICIIMNRTGAPLSYLMNRVMFVWAAQYDAWGKVKKFVVNEVDQPLRLQGQYFDRETGLYYNRFRYYEPGIGSFISQDPLGLAAGANVYWYGPNINGWLDPLGLIHENTPGFHVYGLYEPGATKPYYVGVTDDLVRREYEHILHGRLTKDATIKPIHQNITYGEARGYEQANIEYYGTKTGTRGQDVSKAKTYSERGNKNNSFDHNSKTRTTTRQNSFEEAYKREMKRFNKSKGCS